MDYQCVMDRRLVESNKGRGGCVVKSTKIVNQEFEQYNQDAQQFQHQQSLIIQHQPTPFAPYQFNTLSLISSFIIPPKPQSTNNTTQILTSQIIQANKQKYYNEKLRKSQINRERFMNRMDSIVKREDRCEVMMVESKEVEIEDDNVVENVSRDVSLTFSGEHDMLSMTNRNSNNSNRITLLTTDKKYVPIEMTSSIDVSSTNQSKQKKKKVVIIKKTNSNNNSNHNHNNNKQSLLEEWEYSNISQQQQSEQQEKRKDGNNLNLNNSNSSNEFMFLSQYHRDQKQIMDRLLNIIEKEMHNNSNNMTNNRERETRTGRGQQLIMMDKMLLSKQLTIKQLQANRRMNGNRMIQKQNNNHNRHNESTQTNNNNDTRSTTTVNQNNNFLHNSNNNNINVKPNHFKPQKSQFQNQQTDGDELQGINFQQLYQRLKEQHQCIKRDRQESKSKSCVVNVPSPIQLSSISHSHQTSVNQTILNSYSQTQTKNMEEQRKGQQQGQHISMREISRGQDKNEHTDGKKWEKKLSYLEKIQEGKIQNCTNMLTNPTKQPTTDTNTKKQFKQSVLMQIPLFSDNDNSRNKQSISLADAFKKKFGASRGQSKSQLNKRVVKESNNQSDKKGQRQESELKQQQNHILNNQLAYKKTINNSNISNHRQGKIVTQTKNQCNKQNINSLQQTPRTQSHNNPSKSSTSIKSTNNNNSNNKNNNKSLTKQPPKQLIDRLIYGKKVNMTKKDMYELSKKNYMKLPEVEEKKKQQEKRQKQIQRLEKIKEYQKRIRASRIAISSANSISYINGQQSSTTSLMQ